MIAVVTKRAKIAVGWAGMLLVDLAVWVGLLWAIWRIA